MPFPLALADRTFASGPELAAAIEADAEAGGGTVVPDEAPHRWLARIATTGALAPAELRGLCAALIQRGRPGSVCAGARLAMELDDGQIGLLCLRALQVFDVGLLLALDPGDPESSVEDVLLLASASLADASDPGVRHDLLQRLRNAGLAALEVRVLAQHGSPAQISEWLPAVLAEDVPAEDLTPLGAAMSRGDDVASALTAVLSSLDEARRRAILATALR